MVQTRRHALHEAEFVGPVFGEAGLEVEEASFGRKEGFGDEGARGGRAGEEGAIGADEGYGVVVAV